MKFENTEVFNFEGALRGMRNPMESWEKSDSNVSLYLNALHSMSSFKEESYNVCRYIDSHAEIVHIGKNDMRLAQRLIRAGGEHRKFMRQIFVSVDITAPLFWWKEFDTYKVSTVANSTSTMHKLATTPITMECFEMDDYQGVVSNECEFVFETETVWRETIDTLEQLRLTYLKTNDKLLWKELIQLLPESWLQTRTVTMNYENLLNMCSKGQRRFHKLNEWSGIDNPNVPNFISWARTLPYAQELIFIDEVEEGN